ncbi:protein ANTAGONIST OF LIKE HETEROCHROMATIN PROTEIN 1-like [Monomorium pharaonis]|uniref:protein ANTAGONIST OF LIKE HETEROCHROMATIN PROTEIN 1-like n=1 Tax=Monomorium pharaonis TaxID=307658 RepID=UPI0017478FF8|nr:protein ANTAGONIST OF LIKE HETEROCHROMATIN PROTEIN 1-like [Monomorium pharaonis]XP_036144771.1 protein ANTAGONIST OF LIKE HETEROCHROMATIN PROTEIN 1-like [Monomorium pharaonis]
MDSDLFLSIIALQKQIIKERNKTSILKLKKLVMLFLLCQKNEQNKIVKRKYWVHPIFSNKMRKQYGASNTLIKELHFHNDDKFINYFRMNMDTYKKLLNIIGPHITKQKCIRDPIQPNTRLEICLRYLASGDSMKSLSYMFRIGTSTISKIIFETCDVIWNVLQDKVFPQFNKDLWEHIASKFEEKWNFPHCIGAMDGKHVMLQAPPNSGSIYYNYKGQHSLNLFALCDAEYRFIVLDIGAEGRQSDGGVFRKSKLYSALEENLLQIPPPKIVNVRGPVLPYVIVADEAFGLKNYLMRPYSRSQNLDRKKKIFNYRLSRARRTVESSFGILTAKWRIYRKPIIASITLSRKIVQATCCLHNFIINHENSYKYYSTLTPVDANVANEALQDNINEINSYSKNAAMIRDKFADYFVKAGAVTWQWEKAFRNEF